MLPVSEALINTVMMCVCVYVCVCEGSAVAAAASGGFPDLTKPPSSSQVGGMLLRRVTRGRFPPQCVVFIVLLGVMISICSFIFEGL